MIDITIIIINYNGKDFLEDCLNSLLKMAVTTNYKMQIVCVDNNSFDGSREIIKQHPFIKIILFDRNIGYAAANNHALKHFQSRYYLLLNPDTLIHDSENLNKMINYLELNEYVAAASCLTLNQDKTVQRSITHSPQIITGIAEQLKINNYLHSTLWLQKIGEFLSPIFPNHLSYFNVKLHQTQVPINVNFVWGAYFLLTNRALEAVGYFDENFFLFWEDADWCYRAKEAGFEIKFVPYTDFIHLRSQSQKSIPAFSYYWHIASYFRIFTKYSKTKLIIWSVISSFVQLFLLFFNILKLDKKSIRSHAYLVMLSLSFGSLFNKLKKKILNDYQFSESQ